MRKVFSDFRKGDDIVIQTRILINDEVYEQSLKITKAAYLDSVVCPINYYLGTMTKKIRNLCDKKLKVNQ